MLASLCSRLGLALLLGLCAMPTAAQANWTLNLGYHNPVNSQLGVNFLYWGSQWNFEVGIGWWDGDVHADDDGESDDDDDDDDSVAAAVAGDFDLKYRFTTGGIAPYIQAGMSASTAASVGDDTGAGVHAGGPFAGLGLMLGNPGFHVYVAGNYLIDSEDTQVQAGIGFDI